MTIQETYGRPAVCVQASATVTEAAALLAERRLGALVVTDEQGEPVGLVTDRDVVAKVVAPVRDPQATKVADIMARDIPSVGPLENASRCAERMRKAGTRHLLVKQGDRLLGVVAMRDIIRALLADREAEVQHLSDYIAGETR